MFPRRSTPSPKRRSVYKNMDILQKKVNSVSSNATHPKQKKQKKEDKNSLFVN
tara:strand:+ start:1525 stop:1683 length:159 start_codon:yes stop_codon:yes gene_type:complete